MCQLLYRQTVQNIHIWINKYLRETTIANLFFRLCWRFCRHISFRKPFYVNSSLLKISNSLNSWKTWCSSYYQIISCTLGWAKDDLFVANFTNIVVLHRLWNYRASLVECQWCQASSLQLVLFLKEWWWRFSSIFWMRLLFFYLATK